MPISSNAKHLGLIIYALGFGFAVVVRSIVTQAANANNISIPLLYSGLAIAETAGSFIGATVLTAAFTSTIGKGGVVAGIPFLICSVSQFFHQCTSSNSHKAVAWMNFVRKMCGLWLTLQAFYFMIGMPTWAMNLVNPQFSKATSNFPAVEQ